MLILTLMLSNEIKLSYAILIQASRNEKNSGEATNQEILPATMVGWRTEFFISNRLKRLEKLSICRRQVM